jgi:hypothetical protein
MYKGQSIMINLGSGGLMTDMPQARIAPTKLIDAKNVSLINGYAEKHPGNRPWNNTFGYDAKLPSEVLSFVEYYPKSKQQQVIVLCKNGRIYRFDNPASFTQLTAATGSPATLTMAQSPHLLVAGGLNRRVFVFSGNDQVQIVDAATNTYRNIQKPSPDWTASAFPSYGVLFRSRLWCFGVESQPDVLYASRDGDPEDFDVAPLTPLTDPLIFDVAAGDGEGISGLFVFKDTLFICKNPTGLYRLNSEGVNPANWYITKVNSDFGLAGSHGVSEMFDDVLLFNSQGTITSLAATFKFGDIETADVLNQLGCERYFRQDVSNFNSSQVSGVYYAEKKQFYFSYTSKSAQYPNRLIIGDMFQRKPEITLKDNVQPNCLGLIKDINGISRPFYGSNDGYIYAVDDINRSLDSVSTESGFTYVAQTPHMDFSFADPNVGAKNKRFDFLEITFAPTGNWDLYVDVYIDSELKETIQYNLSHNRPLDSMVLDTDKVEGEYQKSIRKPLHGLGRTISFKLRAAGVSQNIKIQSLMVYFRVSDERQNKDPRT